MSGTLQNRLDWLRAAGVGAAVRGGLRGVEKECLRVTPAGTMALTPHPAALGSALTHPFITTDYSEALLEFVTPPVDASGDALDFLLDVHQFTAAQLDDELLWAASMPCAMTTDDAVPIARYGTSNVAMLKHVYRRGLGYRYGRVMQTISGIHFNYSIDSALWAVLREHEGGGADLQTFVSEGYFRLLRNFRRYGWLVLYLFGCSPAICRSFLAGDDAGLARLGANTLYGPYATSLRMSDIGYKNQAQSKVVVSLASLEAYVRDLRDAISRPYPPYEDIGVQRDGEYRQLSANLLQIENEFYSNIRPKRVVHSGERPTDALQRRGVEYVELRAIDVNLFDPAGIDEAQLRFLELFVLLCMLNESAQVSDDELRRLEANWLAVAREGRRPGLKLARQNASGGADEIALNDWALRILDHMRGIAELADAGLDDAPYTRALEQQFAKQRDADATPSAQVLAQLADRGESFFEFGMRLSRQHMDFFRTRSESHSGRRAMLAEEAAKSLGRQAAIEAADSMPFDEYLSRYLAGTLEPTERRRSPEG
ncbi:MAG: glutamate--cysteine ligase [Pseudomonadota bacterium]